MPPSEQRSKRHHYVPRFYLRRFADQKERLRAYRRTDKRTINNMSTANAAVEVGFYNIEEVAALPVDIAEQVLGKIESEIAPALASLTNDWPPSSETKSVVAGFIALQSVRTREHRHQLDAVASGLASTLRNMLEGRGSDGAQLGDEYVRLDDLEQALRPSRNQSVIGMFEMSVAMERYLLGRSWCLFRSKKRAFVTTDSPVVLAVFNPDPLRGYGVATADAVLFPIDSRHLLAMLHPGPIDSPDIVDLSPSDARGLSNYVAVHAYEWVFSDPRSSVLDEIDLPTMPKSLGEISGIGSLWGPGHDPRS